MNPIRTQQSYPLGLVLFAIALAFYKAAVLATEMGMGFRTHLNILGLDTFYLALIFLMAILRGASRSKVLKLSFWFVLVFMTFIYLVDSFVLLALDDHAALFDIGRYTPEMGVVLSFFDVRAYSAILLLLVSMVLVPAYNPAMKKFSYLVLMLALVFAGLGAVYTAQPLLRYAMLNPLGFQEVIGSQKPYSNEQIEFYSGLDQGNVDIPASEPDIILLVIESLSSINSKKVSGAGDLLEGFDKLAEQGVLFRNFFANHQASEGGLIALLGGYPPMHFPNASPYMFDEFAIQPSVTEKYRQQGYFVGFLTNSDLGFIGLNHYLDGLGLDRSRGRDEVDAMRKAPRVVQDAPSDALLYAEALLTIRQLSSAHRPFLLAMATTSTHLPYTHPEEGADTPEAVWEWSLQQLTEFYLQLSESGYFEHGILLVTGDHRQMRPLTAMETARYGGSARARVPLLVIGKGYPAGFIDERFFQQSDLLRMLGKIQQTDTRLSPQPIWVERYNRRFGRIELIDSLSVFDEADLGRHEYHLKVPGNRIQWLGEKPDFARRIEARIHAQRSLHQRVRSSVDEPVSQER
jgi:phosphoglycerol transferase MdoB-like AlkP superfamily enzyme